MYSTTARAYDDAFVQTTVEFGNEMTTLRQYRDDLSAQYGQLQLRKMELMLSNGNTAGVQAQMDEVASTKLVVTNKIDELMAVQGEYLSTCMHARA